MAISHALQVLSWLEMPKKDRPPREIWLNEEELERHFLNVEHRYGGQGTEAVPDLEQNELTRGLRG